MRPEVKEFVKQHDGDAEDALRAITREIEDINEKRDPLVRIQHELLRALLADSKNRGRSLRTLGKLANMSHQNVALIRDELKPKPRKRT